MQAQFSVATERNVFLLFVDVRRTDMLIPGLLPLQSLSLLHSNNRSSRIRILRIVGILKFTNFETRNDFYFLTLLSFETSKYCIFTKCKLKLQ